MKKIAIGESRVPTYPQQAQIPATPKPSNGLLMAINDVNNDIAYDMPPETTAEEMAEACIDASRLEMSGHPEAQAEVYELIQQYGYPAVLQELAKHVSTV